MVASADYLNNKWTNLVKEKQELISELEKCQKNTKGFKIAGLATLGVSAIGIGVNIGEAVKINRLEDEVDAAKKRVEKLDTDINKAKNTCGTKNCPGTASIPNAAEPVCIKDEWKVLKCAEGYKEQDEHTCKRDGKEITYYDECVLANTVPESAVFPDGYDPNALGPSVVTVGNRQWEKLLAKCAESDNCNGDAGEELGAIVGGESVCINGKWWSKGGVCPEGYTHETNKCSKNGEEIVYIRDCQENLYLSSIDQDADHVNIGVNIKGKKGKDKNKVLGGIVDAKPDIELCAAHDITFKKLLGLADVKKDEGTCKGKFYLTNEKGGTVSGDGTWHCALGCDDGARVFLGDRKVCVEGERALKACLDYCKKYVILPETGRTDACYVNAVGISSNAGVDGEKCLCNKDWAHYKADLVINPNHKHTVVTNPKEEE